MQLHKKWCFLSGASSGIGLAIARKLRQKGAHLLLLARGEQRLKAAYEELLPLGEGKLEYETLDVTDYQACQNLMQKMLENLAVPDILINNAGCAYPSSFTEHTFKDLNAMFQCNFFAPWQLLQSCLPAMIKKGRGCLVNVASMAGLLGIYGYSGYAASKAALVLFTQVLRNELKSSGIRVLLLCPGDTLTPQFETENLSKPEETKKISAFVPPLTADVVAGALLQKLVSKRGFLIIPGSLNKLSYWVYQLFPWLVHAVIDADVAQVQKKRFKKEKERK